METTDPDPGLNSWRIFLKLGEELLNCKSADQQVSFLTEFIESHVPCKVKIQLIAPAYPLPGENRDSVLEPTREKVHQLVAEKFSSLSAASPLGLIADYELPLITEEHLLGIIDLHFPEPKKVSRKSRDFLEGALTHAALSMQVHRQEIIKIWRSEQLGLVKKVTSQISNFSNLSILCTQIARAIKKTYQFFNVGIFTLDPDKRTLSLSGTSQAAVTQDKVQVGVGMVGSVAKTGQEIYAADVKQEPRYLVNVALPETRSEVAIPIKMENQLLGVLNIESDKLDAFHGLDLYVLHTLADNIAVAMMNARLYSNLQRRADQNKAVLEVSHVLNTILDPDSLLFQVVQLIHKRFKYPYVHLYLVSPRSKKIKYQIGYGSRAKYLAKNPPVYDMNDQKGMIPWVARNKKSLLSNDVDGEPLYRPGAYTPIPTLSELTCPMLFNDQVIGVLDIQSHEKNAFDESDLSLIEMLASTIAITIHNANLFRSEQWRRKVADSFRNVAILMAENTPIENLLAVILENLQKNLPCDSSAIWLLKKTTNQSPSSGTDLYLAAAKGVDTEKISEIRANDSNIRKWLNSALSASEPRIRKPQDPKGPLGAAKNYPVEYSSIAMPLRVGDQVLGLLTLAHHKQGQYGQEARAIVTTFASYASVALQNANSYANAQVQAWTSTVLLQVAEATQNLTTIEDIFGTMTRLIPLLIGVNECAMFIWEEPYNLFSLKAAYNIETRGEVYIHPSESPAFGRMLATKNHQIILDPSSELKCPEFCELHNEGITYLLPLVSRDEVLGALLVSHENLEENNNQDNAQDQTLSILQGITHQLAVAVENIQLLELKQEEAYVTAVLLQVAQAVVTQTDLQEALSTIIHLMPILVGIDACVLYLVDLQTGKLVPRQSYAGSRQKEKDLLTREYSEGEFEILDWVRTHDASKTCYLIPDHVDPLQWHSVDCNEIAPGDPQKTTDVLMGFPISYRGEFFGVLLAREMNIKTRFHEKRIEIISGISQQIALAIQNDNLEQEKVARERLQQEVQLARQIQESFLPEKLPSYPGWDINIRWQTARQVGGDFYDLIPIDRHTLGLVIADVSDKGIPAALYMTVSRTLIRAFAKRNSSPTRVFRLVNEQLLRDTPNSLFVTSFYATLDLLSGKLVYCNAGHNLPILLRQNSSEIKLLEKGGIALGVVEDGRFEDHILQIDPGDILMMYTDGVTDTFSPTGDQFGDERLYDILAGQKFTSVNHMLEHIRVKLDDFRGNAVMQDDLTILAVKKDL